MQAKTTISRTIFVLHKIGKSDILKDILCLDITGFRVDFYAFFAGHISNASKSIKMLKISILEVIGPRVKVTIFTLLIQNTV